MSLERPEPRLDIQIPVDHLVLATPDLERSINDVDNLLGVRATLGGRHPGRGTRNALVSLGDDVYLEIVAPDPEQPNPAQPRAFGLDGLTEPRLTAWAAKSDDVEAIHARAESNGIHLGSVQRGSRQRPDGIMLSWRYTDPATVLCDGLIPFFIDWGDSPHPAATAPRAGRLLAFRAEHPDADAVQRQLQLLGVHLEVARAARPALSAVVDGRRGRVELR